MACGGPSQELAYQQATEFLKTIKEELQLNHVDIHPENQPNNFANLRTEQIVNFMVLEDIIKDIFWTDACLSF